MQVKLDPLGERNLFHDLLISAVLLLGAYASSLAQSARSAVDAKVNERDGQPYVWIPAGNFMMGCSPGDCECNEDEKPAHPVTIAKGFWMAQMPTTVRADRRFARETETAFPPGKDSRGRRQNDEAENDLTPVVRCYLGRSREILWMGGMRLPTEAEWEYSARAGTTGPRYGTLDDIAWYGDNSGTKRIDSEALWRNLWTQDLLYELLASGEARYCERGRERRAIRGGTFTQPARWARVSRRGGLRPAVRNSATGFRCAGE